MRTTLTLDDDALASAQEFAQSRRISLGKAVSVLVRRGMAHRQQTRDVNGLRLFELPEDSPTITSSRVKELESEGW